MAGGLRRGEVWMHAFRKPDETRPVVVLSRQSAIPLMHHVLVAPVSSTIRGAASEVVIGIDEGLKHDSGVSLDHVQAVEQSSLRRRLGSLGAEKMREICRALAIATGCDESGPPAREASAALTVAEGRPRYPARSQPSIKRTPARKK